MAGTEHSGWSNSFPELFKGAKWAITPLENEVLSRGLDMTKMTLEELDEIYNLVKKNAKN